MTFQDFQTECVNDASQVQDGCEVGAASGASTSQPLKLPATLKQIAAHLGISEANLKNKWFSQKIVPIYDGYECPPLRTNEGVTDFGFQAIQRFHLKVITGNQTYEEYRDKVRSTLTPLATQQTGQTAVDKARAMAEELRQRLAEKQGALVLRNQSALTQAQTAQETTELLKESVELAQANLQAEKEAAEMEEETQMKLRILEKLMKEQRIEQELREQLGMGK